MLRLVAITLLLLAVFAPAQAGPGNSDCAHWCAANFANPGSDCTSLAAHGGGPCYICGPRKTSPTEQLCDGKCSETSSDAKNCGACGKSCPTGAACQSSSCICTNSNKPPCNGQCPDLNTDNNNCGTCGNVCPAGSTCRSGSCICTNSNKPPCNGHCPDLSSDNNNCGACGNVCPHGTTCKSGSCVPICTAPEILCGSTCVNPENDNNNCGTCGLVCASPSTCVNGVCSVPSCNGKTCGTFVNCSPGGTLDCQCYTTADGTGFCAHNQLCANLADCKTNADCGPGSVCAVHSCCTRNVCLPASCGNPARRLMSLAKKHEYRRQAGSGCWTDGC